MSNAPETQSELDKMAASLAPVLEGEKSPKRGTVKNPYVCDDWSEAFSVCREVNRPIMARVMHDGMAKLYPSGRFQRYDSDPGTKWQVAKP